MITIRYKKLNPKKYSIYLDYFVRDSNNQRQRKYEFLRLYVSRDYSESGKPLIKDKDALELARRIRSKREVEIFGNGEAKTSGRKSNLSLSAYIDHQIQHFGKAYYTALLNKLKKFTDNKDVSISTVTLNFIEQFFEYLQTATSRNNAIHISWMLRSVMNKALKENVIDSNPFDLFSMPSKNEPERTYLELHEIRTLANTKKGAEPLVRQLFLLGCFTGLRYKDLVSLEQGNIIKYSLPDGETGMKLLIRPQKTKNTSGKLLEIPLSEQAQEILEELKIQTNAGIYFSRLPSRSNIDTQLKAWAKEAGINKKMHMHVSRHSFATLCLSSGVDLYTTSKLLGHDKIQNTEIYAKLLGERLLEEICKFPNLMKSTI